MAPPERQGLRLAMRDRYFFSLPPFERVMKS
jgi:hypothetical protein